MDVGSERFEFENSSDAGCICENDDSEDPTMIYFSSHRDIFLDLLHRDSTKTHYLCISGCFGLVVVNVLLELLG